MELLRAGLPTEFVTWLMQVDVASIVTTVVILIAVTIIIMKKESKISGIGPG